MPPSTPSPTPAVAASAEDADDRRHRQRPHEPGRPPIRKSRRATSDDWLTAAVVFAVLGGCAALWLFELSPITGAIAAFFSGLAGILFADS